MNIRWVAKGAISLDVSAMCTAPRKEGSLPAASTYWLAVH